MTFVDVENSFIDQSTSKKNTMKLLVIYFLFTLFSVSSCQNTEWKGWPNETNLVTEVLALYDHLNNVVIYKDVSVSACFVEHNVGRLRTSLKILSVPLAEKAEHFVKSGFVTKFCGELPIFKVNSTSNGRRVKRSCPQLPMSSTSSRRQKRCSKDFDWEVPERPNVLNLRNEARIRSRSQASISGVGSTSSGGQRTALSNEASGWTSSGGQSYGELTSTRSHLGSYGVFTRTETSRHVVPQPTIETTRTHFRVTHNELERRRLEDEQQRALFFEERGRIAAEQQERRIAAEQQRRRNDAEQQQRRITAEEQQRRISTEQRRIGTEEQERRIVTEEQRRIAAEEQQRLVVHRQREVAENEERRNQEALRLAAEERKRLALEEQYRLTAEEQRRVAAEEIKGAEESQRLEEERRRSQDESLRLAADNRRTTNVEDERRVTSGDERRYNSEVPIYDYDDYEYEPTHEGRNNHDGTRRTTHNQVRVYSTPEYSYKSRVNTLSLSERELKSLPLPRRESRDHDGLSEEYYNEGRRQTHRVRIDEQRRLLEERRRSEEEQRVELERQRVENERKRFEEERNRRYEEELRRFSEDRERQTKPRYTGRPNEIDDRDLRNSQSRSDGPGYGRQYLTATEEGRSRTGQCHMVTFTCQIVQDNRGGSSKVCRPSDTAHVQGSTTIELPVNSAADGEMAMTCCLCYL